jgi:RND family efflux transporter MFP subunit
VSLLFALLREERVKPIVKMVWLPVLLLFCFLTTGCGRPPAQASSAAPPPPPEVLVSLPVTREVTDYEDFHGRTDAVFYVQLRARVTGYVGKVNFREGEDVKEGDVLYEIDPRPYQADLDRAEGQLALADAQMVKAEKAFTRVSKLRGTVAASQEDYDNASADRGVAQAAVKSARAAVEAAKLNLAFTKVVAPLSGRVSSRFVDPGNLVKADDTILTTIVSFDPMYAYFDVDEHNTLQLQSLIRQGKISWSNGAKTRVLLGLANEEGFSRQGTINFADNTVDPDTGTWRLRGLFDNADRVLSRGLYVRIRLPIGQPYRATLIAEQALGTDQGQKFVYVVDDAKQVTYRRVKVGRLHDGLRVIADGLAPGEKVVVSGLQRIRQGIEVNPKLVDMPVASARDAEPKSASRNSQSQTVSKSK